MAKKMGVCGFPSLFFSDSMGNRLFVYGSKPYQHLENAFIYPKAVKQPVNPDHTILFGIYPTLTTKEFAVLADLTLAEAETYLQERTRNKRLATTKAGMVRFGPKRLTTANKLKTKIADKASFVFNILNIPSPS